MQSQTHKQIQEGPRIEDALLRVDILAADEGLSYWLRLRASDSCQVWTEESSDGANSIIRRCERCDEPEWNVTWLKKLTQLRSQVSWTDNSEAYDAAYSTAVEADLEQRITFLLDDGITKQRPLSAADYVRVREVARRLWQEARSRLPDWNEGCSVIDAEEL